MTHFVHAHYRTRDQADVAVNHLLEAGAAPDEVRVMVRDGARVNTAGVRYDMRIGRSALVGAVLGVLVGAVLGAMGAFGIFASNTGVALAQGAIGGLLLGVFAGAVRGRGWWDRGTAVDSREPDMAGVMVGVSTTRERAEELKQALMRAGGLQVGITERPPEAKGEEELHVAHAPPTGRAAESSR